MMYYLTNTCNQRHHQLNPSSSKIDRALSFLHKKNRPSPATERCGRHLGKFALLVRLYAAGDDTAKQQITTSYCVSTWTSVCEQARKSRQRLLEALDHPKQKLQRTMAELLDNLLQAHLDYGDLCSDQRQLIGNRDRASEASKKLHGAAAMHLQAKNDDLARDALIRKQIADRTAREFNDDMKQTAKKLQKLLNRMKEIEMEIEDIQVAIDALRPPCTVSEALRSSLYAVVSGGVGSARYKSIMEQKKCAIDDKRMAVKTARCCITDGSYDNWRERQDEIDSACAQKLAERERNRVVWGLTSNTQSRKDEQCEKYQNEELKDLSSVSESEVNLDLELLRMRLNGELSVDKE